MSSASPAPGLWTGAQRRLPRPSRGSSEQDSLFLWQVSGLGSFGALFWASGTPGSSAWGPWLLEGAHSQDRLETGSTGWVLLEQNENFWGRAHRAGRLAQGWRLASLPLGSWPLSGPGGARFLTDPSLRVTAASITLIPLRPLPPCLPPPLSSFFGDSDNNSHHAPVPSGHQAYKFHWVGGSPLPSPQKP